MDITRLFQILSTLGVPVALAIAVGNAFWQSHLQLQRIRHDLFQKRFEVYCGFRSFITNAVSKRAVGSAELEDFTRQAMTVEFLFKKDVVSYMHEVHEKGSHLEMLSQLAKNMESGGGELSDPQKADLHHTLEWLGSAAINRLGKLFSPYLRLS